MKKLYLPYFFLSFLRSNCAIFFLQKIVWCCLLFISLQSAAQSNHTVIFSGSATDFNTLEMFSAGNTNYYITFDQNNLYIGAFHTPGNFAANDNLAIYIDTDPRFSPLSGNGTKTGMAYNGVTATLPFNADYNVYAEELVQQANKYSGSWTTNAGIVYATGGNYREVKIPFASIGNPYALNITLWIGNAGSFYSNVPGTALTSTANPLIKDYFGTFGIKNGTQGNVNPVNVITSPATGYTNSSSISSGTYAYVDVNGNTSISGMTLAPGGVINVQSGRSLTSTGTINNTGITNNEKSTQINVSGTYTLKGRASCSYFNVNDGGTYNHNSAGSVANGTASDWPGINYRTYGNTSNVNILQWAQNTGTAVVGIPSPTSGGWGYVTFDIAESFPSVWNQKGAFNNVAGDLVMKNIGTNDKSKYYLTFNPPTGDSVINIGGNFEMNMPDENGIFLSLANSAAITETMNVHGDFTVKGGHLKFGYGSTKIIINYWGNYSQSGGEIKAYGTGGVTINAFGINKTISAKYSLLSGTSFNSNNIKWIITKDAIIGLASDLFFNGGDVDVTSNVIISVYGTLNCNGFGIKDWYSLLWINNPGNATFILEPGGTLGITDGSGISKVGSNSGNVQMKHRTFSTQANYVYNGTSNQSTGSGLPATVNSLTIDNSGTSNKTVSLTNDVYITSYHEIAKGIFSLGDKNVTLHSGPDTTASFHELNSAGSINYNGSGRYIVERYINTGTGAGQHGKSWQLLSTPADGETIRNTWQEGGSNDEGYGTWITDPSGTANGFDASSPSPSIKTYNAATGNFDGVGSTNNLIANPKGYFLFVRGDRSATNLTSPATPTTLRIKGKLFTGNQIVSVPAGSFQSVGNPYASAVDFQKIHSQSPGIDNSFYVWDPSIAGTYGVGGYQTVSGVTGFIAIPGASSIYNSSMDYRDIQSGQAIFVHNSTTSDVGVNFSEDCKKTGSRLVNRGGGAGTQKQLLFTNLYTSSGVLADGNAVVFDNSFSNKVDKDDALKISNAGENFGLIRNNKTLAVEARSAVALTDTVFYDMHNLRQQSYQLLFIPKNMEPVRQAFFIDRYLNTGQPVSLADSTVINFRVTPDVASAAADRFMLVFRTLAGPLSVLFVSVNAYRNNSFVQVEWKTENENNMDKYEIESSVDGIHFNTIGTVEALNLPASSYNYTDVNPATGNNYYRIRSIEKDGAIKYTKVIKVPMEKVTSSFSIYPNPIQHGEINLQFTDQPIGKYRLRLLNTAGATLFSETINYTGGTSVRTIEPDKYLPQGVYHIEILTPGGEREVLNFTK